MTVDTKYDNKIYDNLCTAIKSLGSENKYAFVPFFSSEERDIMAKFDNHYSKPILKVVNSIIAKATHQVAECINIPHNPDNDYYEQIAIEERFVHANPHYSGLHTDSGYSVNPIRLTLALKGKGTVFTIDQSKFPENQMEPSSTSVVTTPDLHLSVFTAGNDESSGAIHGSPICDGSPEEGDCLRYLVQMTFAKPETSESVEQ